MSLKEHTFLLPLETIFDSHYVYLIYPYLITLADVLFTNSLSYQHIKHFIKDIGHAILTLHQHNILHNDISFQNVFVDEHNHFFLGDFSSAKLNTTTFSDLYYKKKYHRTGTPLFLLPQETNSDLFYQDIYSFCFLLFMLLHGDVPTKNCIPENKAFETIDTILFPILYQTSTSTDTRTAANLKDLQDELIVALSKNENIFMQMSFSLSENSVSYIKEDTLDILSDKNNPLNVNHFQTPKKGLSTPVPFYGLLFLCCCIFLFSLYHAFFQKQSQKKDNGRLFSIVASSPAIYDTATPTNTTMPTSTNKKKALPLSDALNISDCNYKAFDFSRISTDKNKLRILFAGKNCFQNTSSFSNLIGLEELYLNDNEIQSLTEISTLKSLKILNLSNNNIKNILPLKELSSLTILDLSHNTKLQSIHSLSSLTKLQYLILTNTNVTKTEVNMLQKELPLCTILY